MAQWYKNSFRRNLVDMHIEDWDEKFLSKLDPKVYVERLKTAQVQSAMIYANSHVGYSYWPTKVGHMHSGLKGKDFFGEVTELCNKEGIDVIAYYTLIFVNWPYEQHPEWRMRTSDGRASRELKGSLIFNGRYGMCCPNNMDYRAFVKAEVDEILGTYDVKGIFYDMMFWPIMCYCDSCRERFQKEVGKEIPTIIDFSNPDFLTFAMKRDEWLLDFAMFSKKITKDIDPGLTVEHNLSITLTDAVEFSAGDNYGGMFAQNLTGKLMNSVSPNLPFEFMASRCYPSLFAHTSTKPKEMLALENYMALSNGGAFFFIDGINLEGTMSAKTYEIMGEIFEESKKYEPYRGGKLSTDIAVYRSESSDLDPSINGTKADDMYLNMTMESFFGGKQNTFAVAATRILKENHIPYTVIRKKNLKDFSKYQVVVMPNISVIDPEEESSIENWVKNGGKLYISSSVPLNLVSKMLNMTGEGMTKEVMTYIYPTGKGQFMVEGTTNESEPVSILEPQLKVKLNGDAEVLATIGIPFTDPADGEKFASIHANPPGYNTEYPAIVHGKYGKGEIIWSSVPLESPDAVIETPCQMFAKLIKSLASKPFVFKSDASPYVEITLFDQPEDSRCLVNFVNLQEKFPIIPVSDVDVSVKLDNRKVKKVVLLPDERVLDHKIEDDYVTFKIGNLYIYEAAMVYYEKV